MSLEEEKTICLGKVSKSPAKVKLLRVANTSLSDFLLSCVDQLLTFFLLIIALKFNVTLLLLQKASTVELQKFRIIKAIEQINFDEKIKAETNLVP